MSRKFTARAQATVSSVPKPKSTLVLAEETNPATELEAPTVEVVGTTPLPGIGTPID